MRAHPFTDEELLCIFEAARIGLADAETFETIAENMDLADEVMVPLRDKLHDYLNPKEQP